MDDLDIEIFSEKDLKIQELEKEAALLRSEVLKLTSELSEAKAQIRKFKVDILSYEFELDNKFLI